MSDKHTNNFAQSPHYHDDWNDNIGEIYTPEELARFKAIEDAERASVAAKPRTWQDQDHLYKLQVWGGGGMTRSEERDNHFNERNGKF